MLALKELEERIGYHFQDRVRLVRALTHRSRASEIPNWDDSNDNEQLEFLGDAVLGFVVSEELVARRPELREGALSQLKSYLVSATHLFQCAQELQLGQFVILGKGEELSGGRERKTLLADTMEALIGAIHLDGGIEPARGFVARHVLADLNRGLNIEVITDANHKSVLQERAQALGLPTPRYSTIQATGPEHAKVFEVEGRIGDRLAARGFASSKKAASQAAAAELLTKIDSLSDA